MHLLTIVFLAVFMTLGSCRLSQHQTHRNADIQQVADSALGEHNAIAFNGSRTFALCWQTPEGDHARRQYRFIVVRLRDMTTAHEGTFSMGYVSWVDDTSVEVVSGSPSSREGGTKTIIRVNSPVQ